MISAVVLAAGLSRRMGKPKLLLELGAKTIIEHVVSGVLKSKVGETIVVLGANGQEIRQKLSGYDVKFIDNLRYADGQGTSVAAGAAAVNTEARGILFLMGDQPLIAPELMDRLIDLFNNSRAIIVRPGETGTPALFSTKLRDELMRLSGDTGGRQLMEKYKDEVQTVQVHPGPMYMDVDTEEDYQKMRQWWGSMRI